MAHMGWPASSAYYIIGLRLYVISFEAHDPLYSYQGCQMAYFQTKNPDLRKFWSVSQWKVLLCYVYINLVHSMAIW
jgi:hypothetical protein